MTEEQRYPYQLVNTFLVSMSFSRAQKLPPTMELPTNIGIQYTEPGFPRIQVALKLNSKEDSLVPFNLEVIGLFDYIGQKKNYDKELNKEFVEERALHTLWLYSSQMIKLVSSQMGMNPLQLLSPVSFTKPQAKLPTSKKKSGSKKKTTKNPA